MLSALFLIGAVFAIVVPACCPLDLAAAVERARLRASLSHKELAYHQKKSAAQWSREFHAGMSFCPHCVRFAAAACWPTARPTSPIW